MKHRIALRSICNDKAENFMFLTHDELIPFYNENCVVSV